MMEISSPTQDTNATAAGTTQPAPTSDGPGALPSLKTRLVELALVCAKIGATSFGSPTAHIAMMENEFVQRRHWLSEEHFLDLMSAANLIPGPNASETCYHVGYIRAGYPGLLTAGMAFITPAFITTAALGWAYTRYGGLPAVEGIFYFLNPLVLAIVLDTTWRLGRFSIKGWQPVLIFALSLVAKYFAVNETLILLGAGVLGILIYYIKTQKRKDSPALPLMMVGLPLPLIGQFWQTATNWIQSRTLQVFLYFFKTGTVLFGSGLILFGLVEKDVTQRFGWLSVAQLTDAISVGQITPGPVTSASTFIGYLAGGLPGAVAATVGVFLPSFIIVMITAPMVNRMRESELARAFLGGVNASVIALILAVAYTLGRSSLTDVWAFLLLGGGLLALGKFKLMPYVLVVSGLVLGLVKAFIF